MRKNFWVHLTALVAVLLVAAGCAVSRAVDLTNAGASDINRFTGITYQREERSAPRPMVIHTITIDLKANGIKVLVTPGDPDKDNPLEARTTSEFLEDFGVQLAINGDAFNPWWVLGPLYYPTSGDGVGVFGFAASNGTIYSEGNERLPTLFIYRNNKASINNRVGKTHNAISGTKMLVQRGEVLADLDPEGPIHPRTAVGLNRSGRYLTIIIVDGRQPGFSEGATLREMAQLLKQNRVYIGFNLDGGGSSTLAIEGTNGQPMLVNSPIHQQIPGNERPVANHLGIFAREE
jgi:hypothetical protein